MRLYFYWLLMVAGALRLRDWVWRHTIGRLVALGLADWETLRDVVSRD